MCKTLEKLARCPKCAAGLNRAGTQSETLGGEKVNSGESRLKYGIIQSKLGKKKYRQRLMGK